MNRIRLTAAQAIIKYLVAQKTVYQGQQVNLFHGVMAIFGHGNVAGLGLALHEYEDELPTYRSHNEQAMAHTAIAYAKTHNRQRMMACTSSVGPGATNMVTAAALAHVNRLPVLLLPGDVFASRRPDPVLQQVEVFADATISANDCFKPVSRYFDRITRPEQLISSLPVAIQTLTDTENCGPVTLALPQDLQTMAYDYPESMFEVRVHKTRRTLPDQCELERASRLLAEAKRPLIIAGGGVHYSQAAQTLSKFSSKHLVPVAETQAGKGALNWDHSCQAGAIGVTGSSSANTLAGQADVILAVGTRLQDFTTGSRSLFNPNAQLIQLNVGRFDAIKHNAVSLIGDAKVTLKRLSESLSDWHSQSDWFETKQQLVDIWNASVDELTKATDTDRPSDAQVLGAVNRHAQADDIVVGAAGSLPAELHKHWRTTHDKGYHMEYGFSCMGYEIAGGLGVKMARPDAEVYVLVGDGSYLMMNSEIASSVMLGHKLIIVVLDNRGFSCINRLQNSVGGESFNNLLDHGTKGESPDINFAAHAAAMGAESEQVTGIDKLEQALERAKQADKTYVIALKTDPLESSAAGGCWWEVAVPETSSVESVQVARQRYIDALKQQPN